MEMNFTCINDVVASNSVIVTTITIVSNTVASDAITVAAITIASGSSAVVQTPLLSNNSLNLRHARILRQ